MAKKLRTARRILEQKGVTGVVDKLLRRDAEGNYRKWVSRNGKLSGRKRKTLISAATRFSFKPVISIVVPVFNTDEQWLRACIESVLRQTYPFWELCIADDCSDRPHVSEILREFAGRDSRIKLVFRDKNGHISQASNSALDLATGEFVALLDHDDELAEDALFWVANEINAYPEAMLIYTDEDKIDVAGNRSDPGFKPDWSRNLFYSMNYLNHLIVYRSQIVRDAGGFRAGFEGSQDYDLALRVLERIDNDSVRHIAKILYHWRTIPGSVALDPDEKAYPHEVARRALGEHFDRLGVEAVVSRGFGQYHRVSYPFGGEFKVVPFTNPGEMNRVARTSREDVLIFTSTGIEPVTESAFAELASAASQSWNGAAGGKILNSDGTVRSCGFASGGAEPVNEGAPRDQAGRFGAGMVIADVDCFSDVLAIRREVLDAVGGFDRNASDVFADLCLRLKSLGFAVAFTPYAEFRRVI